MEEREWRMLWKDLLKDSRVSTIYKEKLVTVTKIDGCGKIAQQRFYCVCKLYDNRYPCFSVVIIILIIRLWLSGCDCCLDHAFVVIITSSSS